MKKTISYILIVTMCIGTFLLAGCGKGDDFAKTKDATLKAIEQIKTSDYMKEDRKDVEKLVKAAKEKLDKAKDEKDITKLMDNLNGKLKKIPTKKVQVEALLNGLKENIEGLKGEDKAKADKILEEYKAKLDKIESKSELTKISKEITDKISKETGEKIEEVKAEEITEKAEKAQEKSEPVVTVSKKVNKGSSSSSNTSSSNNSSSSSSKKSASNNSGSKKPSSNNSSSSSSSSKPAKKPVWVVDKAAWTETVKEPVYSERDVWIAYTSDGQSKKFYSEDDMWAWLDEIDATGHYQVTTEEYISGYTTKTIEHPEEGHTEYR